MFQNSDWIKRSVKRGKAIGKRVIRVVKTEQ